MRIYVASKFENTTEVWEAMNLLRGMGHTITHDWTHENPGDRKGGDLAVFLAECAQKDMDGVETADALLVINHPAGKGMWTEMGMAIAWGIPVFFCCPERAYNIFTELPGVEKFATIAEAVTAIDQFGKSIANGR